MTIWILLYPYGFMSTINVDFCMHKVNFSQRLIEERKRLGLSQADFAKAGGVTRPTQARYENKLDRSPDVEYLDGLTKIGVDIIYLFTDMRVSHIDEQTNTINIKLYETPNDAFNAVTQLQKELNHYFPGDQLQSIIGFAFSAQASKNQLLEFIRSAYEIAGLELPEQMSAADE